MRCSNCDKTIATEDRFCRHCGQRVAVLVKEEPPKSPFPGRAAIPIEYSDFGPGEILASFESLSGAAWGAHIYTGSSQHSSDVKTRPEGCPDWVEKKDWFYWFRRGLVVWDHDSHSLGAILAGEAIELLKKLQTDNEWETQGIAIVERRTDWLPFDKPPRSKRSRKRKGTEPETEPPSEAQHAKPKVYEQERLRLKDYAAEEFVAYLQTNEDLLKQMADEEEKLEQQVQLRVIEVFLQVHHRHELKTFDGAGRKFSWVRQAHPLALVCNIPPDRGTIKLSDDGFWCIPIIERPGYLKIDYERFLQLEEALDWVERKIPELRAQAEERARVQEREEAEEREKIAALPKKDLTPYWIAPSALEPTRLTYRVIIELEYEPYSSKKTEISFGEFWYSDEEFYTPTMLARELKLALNQVEVQQPSRYLGWYRIHSLATYYESSLAAAQAQQVWDSSTIGEGYRQQKVIRARYGFEEVETAYRVWLGGFEKPDLPWPPPETRADYLARCAREETLLYALDVNGYRQFKELSYEYFTDEKLLVNMHRARAKSRYLPAEVCAESKQWLRENAHDA